MSDSAFLSVRVPGGVRDELKAAAADRGQTIQKLVGSLVERFLAEENHGAPSLANVVGRLRGQSARLQDEGIAALWVFGSIARGDARRDSDVDLFAEFDAGVSLIRIASWRSELTELVGAPVDLVERCALRPAVRDAAEREAIQIW